MATKIQSIKEYGTDIEKLFIDKADHLDQEITHNYFADLSPSSCFKAFVAYNDKQEPIGGICAQVCIGPLPLIPDILKFGSIWGFWGNKPVLSILIQKSVCYLRSLGVMKVLTYAYSDLQYEVLTELKFTHSNALACDLNDVDIELPTLPPNITIKPVGSEYDEAVFKHWTKMWTENGVTTFHPNAKDMTFEFLKDARKKYNYRTTAAFDGDKIVGSASNNLFFGVEPCPKTGGAWAVYVHPEYRRHGIGTRLTVEMEKYFKELGCKQIRLIYASDNGRRIYQRKGFKQCNWIALDANEMNDFKDPIIE